MDYNSNTLKFIFFAIFILGVIFLFLSIYYLINIGNRYIDRPKRIKIDLKLIIKVFFTILGLYLLRIIFKKYSILGFTLWSVIIAIVFAYVIDPLVNYLENKGIKRKFGVIIVYISLILIFSILIVSVIPKTIEELTKLFNSLPAAIVTISEKFEFLSKKLFENYNIDLDRLLNQTTQKAASKGTYASANQTINNLLKKFQINALSEIKNLATRLYSAVASIFRLILVLIFSFYFSVDKKRFIKKVQNIIPIRYKKDVFYLARRINTSLQQFIRGRLLMAVFVGFFTMIYLLILRVDFAIVIGLITCVADIIPYIGPFFGFLPAVLFAFMDSPFKALYVAILFVIMQWSENNILAPKLIGNSTGLNPLIVLISIIIGGGVFGVWGMIVSVPIVAIGFILFDFFKMKYNDRTLIQ